MEENNKTQLCAYVIYSSYFDDFSASFISLMKVQHF